MYDLTRILVFLLIMTLHCKAQFVRVETGTSTDLINLSVIGRNVYVNGANDFLIKSKTDCNTFSTLTNPGTSARKNWLNMIDTNVYFFLSNKFKEGATLHRTSDGGSTWQKILDTSGVTISEVAFFNEFEGIVSRHTHFIRTNNGGRSWEYGHFSISGNTQVLPAICKIKIFKDMFFMGINSGSCYLSKDKGVTFQISWFLKSTPADFCFVNKDTIIAVSVKGEIKLTKDGGKNWLPKSVPIDSVHGLYFRSANEGYAFGADTSGNGVLMKTTDLCNSWQAIPTGMKSAILNVNFINDQTIILTGKNGIMMRSGSKTNCFETPAVFPNPFHSTIRLALQETVAGDVSITSMLGTTVCQIHLSDLNTEIDLSALTSEVYVMRVHPEGSQQPDYFVRIVKQ